MCVLCVCVYVRVYVYACMCVFMCVCASVCILLQLSYYTGTKCNYYPEDKLKKLPVVFKKSATEKRKIIYRPGKSICEKE